MDHAEACVFTIMVEYVSDYCTHDYLHILRPFHYRETRQVKQGPNAMMVASIYRTL